MSTLGFRVIAVTVMEHSGTTRARMTWATAVSHRFFRRDRRRWLNFLSYLGTRRSSRCRCVPVGRAYFVRGRPGTEHLRSSGSYHCDHRPFTCRPHCFLQWCSAGFLWEWQLHFFCSWRCLPPNIESRVRLVGVPQSFRHPPMYLKEFLQRGVQEQSTTWSMLS